MLIMLLLWPSAHIFDYDDENNDDDDDEDDGDQKKGANEAPTSFPPNKLVGAEKHLWPSDRPDQARLQWVTIQSQNTTNTKRKYDKYKYKMIGAEKHFWPSDRPDCSESQIQRQNRSNTKTKNGWNWKASLAIRQTRLGQTKLRWVTITKTKYEQYKYKEKIRKNTNRQWMELISFYCPSDT